MPEENKESSKQIISDANKIAQKEATRNDNFKDVSFQEYKNVAGDQMFSKMEGGRVVDTFTESEMNQAIQSRKEDLFYGFNQSKISQIPLIKDDDADVELQNYQNTDSSGGGGGSGTPIDCFVIINGFPVAKKILVQ